MSTRAIVSTFLICSFMAAPVWAQSQQRQKNLVINGKSGTASVYYIDGKPYVQLETLVQIASGSFASQGDTIILIFPTSEKRNYTEAEDRPQNKDSVPEGNSTETTVQPQNEESALSGNFMKTSIESLGAVKQWIDTITYAAKRGVPGDGSRIVVLENRATETLLLATANATSHSDQNALQLLTNNYNTLKGWSDKLIGERRSMDTGKYSVSPDLLDRDETYQKIVACTRSLASMLANGKFQDDRSCH